MGWEWFLPTARYGESWRQGRKVLDRGLGPRAAVVHRAFQESKARVLLTRILASPDEWEAHTELSGTPLSERRPLSNTFAFV